MPEKLSSNIIVIYLGRRLIDGQRVITLGGAGGASMGVLLYFIFILEKHMEYIESLDISPWRKLLSCTFPFALSSKFWQLRASLFKLFLQNLPAEVREKIERKVDDLIWPILSYPERKAKKIMVKERNKVDDMIKKLEEQPTLPAKFSAMELYAMRDYIRASRKTSTYKPLFCGPTGRIMKKKKILKLVKDHLKFPEQIGIVHNNRREEDESAFDKVIGMSLVDQKKVDEKKVYLLKDFGEINNLPSMTIHVLEDVDFEEARNILNAGRNPVIDLTVSNMEVLREKVREGLMAEAQSLENKHAEAKAGYKASKRRLREIKERKKLLSQLLVVNEDLQAART